jgi:hypothetical protein
MHNPVRRHAVESKNALRHSAHKMTRVDYAPAGFARPCKRARVSDSARNPRRVITESAVY